MASFPDISDKDFYDKINEKKEFRIHEILPRESGCEKTTLERFKFMPHQLFISNFLSPETHYTRVLLFHATGSGKTNSLLAIATQYNQLYRNMYTQGLWNKNFIYILAPEEAIQNFRNELRRIYSLEHLDDRNFKQTIQKPKNGGFFKLMGYQDFVNRTLREQYTEIDHIKESNLYKKSPIQNLDNCLLMIDECHKILENNYGEHISRILNRSVGARLAMASGTPMMHTPDEAYHLLEILNPGKLRYEEVFSSPHKLTPNGLQLIREAARGYISYLRGGSPEAFPERIELGELIEGAKFTKVIKCQVVKGGIQHRTYEENFRENEDVIDIEKQAILNFVLPNGMYSKKDLSETLKNLEQSDLKQLRVNVVLDPRTGESIPSGPILQLDSLKELSTKYHYLVKHLKQSNHTTVIYHRYVNGSGVKMIGQMLAQNGFTHYSTNYTSTGHPSNNFVLIHGEIAPADRHKLIKLIKSRENKRGELIRIVVCSEIMSQSVDLKNIKELHILHYQDNYSTIEQIIGRVIRNCSMADLPRNEWRVNIYKYCLTLPKGARSVEEQRYIDKEADYIEIRKICRVFKEVAIDGLLNYKANVFPTDIDGSRECDFQQCKLKLEAQKKLPSVRDATRDTYLFNFYKYEVNEIKHYVSKLFEKKPMANIREIIDYIKSQPDLTYVDDDYIYLAVTELIDNKTPLLDIYNQRGTLKMYGTVYSIKPDIQLEHNHNLVDISNYLHAYRQLKGGPSKISWATLVSTIQTLKGLQLAQYLSRIELDKQRQLLELAITQFHTRGNNENITKVLNNYKRYIFYGSEGSYASLSSFDSIEDHEPIGHFLTSPPRRYTPHGWIPLPPSTQQRAQLPENDIIIGFIERDRNNDMVFKLRDPEEHNRYVDRRHKSRGYVCMQKNDKRAIIRIFDRLGISLNSNDPLENLCSRLELELRKREQQHFKNKKWFYDYFELH